MNNIILRNWTKVDHDTHTLRLEGRDCCGMDLSNRNLRGAGLSLMYFANSNFAGSDLFGADFSFSNLSNCDLTGSNFRGCNLRGANLIRSNIRYATFVGAIFNNETILPFSYERALKEQMRFVKETSTNVS